MFYSPHTHVGGLEINGKREIDGYCKTDHIKLILNISTIERLSASPHKK